MTRGTVRKVSDVVFVQDQAGNVTVLTQDQFTSQFGKVDEDVVVRSRGNGQRFDGHRIGDTYLIHGPAGNEHFQSKEELEANYEV